MANAHIHRRMKRKKSKKEPGLNLVSLMDIFTILVFFLLVNSSAVQKPGGDKIRLPEASVEQPMEESLTITIDSENIVVQGRQIATLIELAASDRLAINRLVEELSYLADRRIAQGIVEDQSVVVVADKDIPYSVIETVMASATAASYDKLSLAVISRASESSRVTP